jgi:negative regulator of flagellin synthesis FlgM
VSNRIKGMDGGSIGPGDSNPVEKIRVSTPVSTTGAGSSSGAALDSVHITQSARSMAALSQAIQDTPDVDAGKVAAAQQAIASGQYTINPERIASRLLQLEQDLHAATSQ